MKGGVEDLEPQTIRVFLGDVTSVWNVHGYASALIYFLNLSLWRNHAFDFLPKCLGCK